MVPEVYLQQLWDTITYVKKRRNIVDHFILKLTTHDANNEPSTYQLTFDLDYLREAIGFPKADSLQNREDFDSIPTNRVMLQGIMDLGYEGHLTEVGKFKTKCLSRLWCTLYAILNRCLKPSERGMDTMTKSTMKFLYGVTYNQHFDYAAIIWDQMVTMVKGKARQQRDYIPFERFFSLVIHQFFQEHNDILKLEDQQIVFLNSMKIIQGTTGSTVVQPKPIPKYLLKLLDKNDPALRAYRALVASTAPVKLQEPTQGMHRLPGEGSSRKGKEKESEGKRKEGDVGVDVSVSEVSKKQKVLPSVVIREPVTQPSHLSKKRQQTDTSDSRKHKRVKTMAHRSYKPSNVSPPDSEATESHIPEETHVESDNPLSSPISPTPISSTINIPQTTVVTPDPMLSSTSGNEEPKQEFSDNLFDF